LKPRPLLLALALVVAVAAGAVSRSDAGTSSSGATIPLVRIGITQPINVLNQAVDAGGLGPTITNLGLETLMKFGNGGQVEPQLAQSVSQPGTAVYVYHLRHGVRFWDGNELTSTDVANAMNYYRFPSTQTAHYYASVKSIKATDRYTVVVTLKHPDASWPPITAFAAMIFEKSFQDAHKTTMGKPGTLTMGTGPWQPVSLDPTSGVEMNANPHYWGGKVNIQHISIKSLSSESSMALAMRAGQLDVALYIGDPRSFSATTGSPVSSVPSCEMHFISMNTHVAPWSDVHVRRAVAYAVNHQQIANAAGTPGTPLTTIIPPVLLQGLGSAGQVDALLKSIPQYPNSVAKAKAELAKSAYPHGFTATFDSPGLYNTEEQAIAGQLAKIGINLKVNDIGINAWLAEVFGPRDKMGILYSGLGCFPDPAFIPNLLLSSKQAKPGALNIADYTSPVVDGLITQGLRTGSPAKRFVIYSKLIRQVASDVPYVPVYGADDNDAFANGFSWPNRAGFWFSQSGWALGLRKK
jgi:peptide/nickel transport system substrate-binding protein